MAVANHLAGAHRTPFARLFHADSEAGSEIAEFILGKLKPVDRSTKGLRWLRVEEIGLIAQVRLAPDSRDRIGFACYLKESAADAKRLSFRRDRQKYRHASRRNFRYLPAPALWALLNGVTHLPLSKAEFIHWARNLLEAAEVEVDEEPDARAARVLEEQLYQKFPPPRFPNPFPEMSAWDKAEWRRFENVLGRRFRGRTRLWLYLIYVHFLERWRASALRTRDGTPCCVKASDSYLRAKLGLASRSRVRTAMDALLRLGLIQAASYVRPNQPKAHGYYAYLPGTGEPPTQAGPLRRPNITPRETLHCMRLFIASARKRRAEASGFGPALVAIDVLNKSSSNKKVSTETRSKHIWRFTAKPKAAKGQLLERRPR